MKEIGGLLISDLPQGSHTTAKATLKVFGSTFLQKGAKKATFYKKVRRKRCEKKED
ncbi:MAG: hypothetical protein IJZ09_02740 [Tidjanibacter sp.]|nr:hypothetical protein [Tidjanibacter sp.]